MYAQGKKSSLKTVSRILLLLLICWVTPPLAAQPAGNSKPKLTWIAYEQAPYFILKGELKGQGVGDFVMQTFISKLPQFQHEIIYANMSRYRIAVQNSSICVPAAWLRKEEKPLIQSRVHMLGHPMGLITHKNTKIPQDITGKVSLQHIMENTTLRLIALKKFEYPDPVLQVLENVTDPGRIMYLKDDTIEINERLLDHGRADIAIGLFGQIANLRAAGKGDQFKFVPITESTGYIEHMTHCSNDAVGQAAMKVINETLTDAFLEILLEKHQKWYPEMTAWQNAYRSYIINRQPFIGTQGVQR